MSPQHGSPECMWLHEHTLAALGFRTNSTGMLFKPEFRHRAFGKSKELFEQRINSYLEHLHMSRRQCEYFRRT
jgi:hypothetical protein